MYNAPRIEANVLEIDAADSPTRIEFTVDGSSAGFVFPAEDCCNKKEVECVAARINHMLPFEVSLEAARNGVAKMLNARGVWA